MGVTFLSERCTQLTGVIKLSCMIERLSQPEHKELALKRLASWLAGLLEPGGAMFLRTTTIKGRKYVTPVIQHSSNRKLEADFLKQRFGGGVHRPSGKNSFKWEVGGARAAEIARTIQPHSLFRQKHIAAFEAWEDADRGERLEIAKDLKESNRNPRFLNPSDYRLEPPVVAGAFDARGGIIYQEFYDPEEGYGCVYPTSFLYSRNRPLLEALKQKYGGEVEISSPTGSEVEIDGKRYVSKYDGLRWRISDGETLANFLSEIKSHVIFKLREVKEALEAVHSRSR